jgi:hypothetical protein
VIVTIRPEGARYVVMGALMTRASAVEFVRELAALPDVELDRGPLPSTDPVVAALAKARGWRAHDLGALPKVSTAGRSW